MSEAAIYVISDGTGETAITMIRAALVQYEAQKTQIIRCKNVRTPEQVESILEEVAERSAFVVYTVVSEELRLKIATQSQEMGINSVDLLGPLLGGLDAFYGKSTKAPTAGILRSVNDRYFSRVEAIEFTVKHDDGKELRDLDQADVILVGISRTSKTPLSVFLSHKGWKVANVPLVLNMAIPPEVFAVDQRKIVALTIDPTRLAQIRQRRVERLGDSAGEYANLKHIHEEIEYALKLYQQNKRWPVFDVTERALEETASEITRIVSVRMGLKEEFF